MNNQVTIAPIETSLPSFLTAGKHSGVIVIADTHTRKFCYPRIKNLLPKHQLITIPAGELHKNLATCELIWKAMTDATLDRHALVINLGGGVIGDMGGFCAATYKRGIDFIQIPTTLLSQVDASVGGKLGIDFQGLKNHLGVFTLPSAVLIDPEFLRTLPVKELRSGFAEVIKHCLIADGEKWKDISRRDLDEQQWPELIEHSVNIKKHIVAQDPTEKGLRKVLNFGHTLGHAVETHFLSKPKGKHLLHGEAIAAGMIMESYLSFRKRLISENELNAIREFIFSVYGAVDILDDDIDPIITLTKQDKKNRGTEVRFSLIDGIGQCQFDIKISSSEMKKAIDYYRQ